MESFRWGGLRALALLAFGISFSVGALTPEAVRAPLDVLDADVLLAAVTDARQRVPEFVALREQAKKLGLRAFLFGGTAAGFVAYVADDLLRRKGRDNYPVEHFAYLLPQIYRPGQDFDVVLDGPEISDGLVRRFEMAIAPYLPGTKGFLSGAECRWLRHPYGTKIALLGNPDALNQNTDSASIGFVELTDPPNGEPIVRDLHRWDDARGAFLETFASGVVRYLPSRAHGTTQRALTGDNPPILAVLRWLGKATQYRLALDPEQLSEARLEIGRYDPKGRSLTGYARLQVDKVGTKIFKHAADVSRAYRLAEKLDLRAKLADGQTSAVGHVGWWAQREPLPAFEVGQGGGKTAAFYDLSVVAHDASTLEAFESLLRAPTSIVNALKSRNVAGERAVHGEGFYVCRGERGAWRTGLNVRFRVRPDAREDSDFKRVSDDVFVILNREILEVIPDALERDPVRFLELLKNFTDADQGAVERLFRGYRALAAGFGADTRRAVVEALKPLLAAKVRSPYLTGFLHVVAEAPFTVEEVAPLVAVTGGDTLAYRLVFQRALRATTAEDARPLYDFMPPSTYDRRQWAQALLDALPPDHIGVEARRAIVLLADRGSIPLRHRIALLRRLARARAVDETGPLSRWTIANPVFRSSAAWKALAGAALIGASSIYGAMVGASALYTYSGFPTYEASGLYYSEANLRAKARAEGVAYDDFVKFAAPLGVGRFPSLPRDLVLDRFLPLLKKGDREEIDRRAEIFRVLVDAWVTAHPFPESREAKVIDPYYREWAAAVRKAAFISLAGERPVADPHGAWAFVMEMETMAGRESDWGVSGYYSGRTIAGDSLERVFAAWMTNPEDARRKAKAVFQAQKSFPYSYDGKRRLWEMLDRRTGDPYPFLTNLEALAAMSFVSSRDRWDWSVPDGRLFSAALELSLREGVEKVGAIAKDADAAGLETGEAIRHLRQVSARSDWKDYLTSRTKARIAVGTLAKSSLGDRGGSAFVQERLRSLEPKHPCLDLLAVWGELARLSKVYPWGDKVDAAAVDAMMERFAREPDLARFVDRFEIAAKYARSQELDDESARELCDSVARRSDVREALAGHYTASQVTVARLGGADAVALGRQAGAAAARAKDPIAFASRYRSALERRLATHESAGVGTMKAALADAAAVVR